MRPRDETSDSPLCLNRPEIDDDPLVKFRTQVHDMHDETLLEVETLNEIASLW